MPIIRSVTFTPGTEVPFVAKKQSTTTAIPETRADVVFNDEQPTVSLTGPKAACQNDRRLRRQKLRRIKGRDR